MPLSSTFSPFPLTICLSFVFRNPCENKLYVVSNINSTKHADLALFLIGRRICGLRISNIINQKLKHSFLSHFVKLSSGHQESANSVNLCHFTCNSLWIRTDRLYKSNLSVGPD